MLIMRIIKVFICSKTWAFAKFGDHGNLGRVFMVNPISKLTNKSYIKNSKHRMEI